MSQLSNLVPLARSIPNLTPSALQHHLLHPAFTPLHLPGLLAPWPALASWRLADDLQRLRQKLGEDRLVEVELVKRGRGYLEPDHQRVHMPFGTFLDAFILGRIPSMGDPAGLPTAYLAQMDLDDARALQDDVPALPHFSTGPKGTLYRRTLWIGPDGTFTPFHKDPYIGLYSQVFGKKTFFVLPPDAADSLDLSAVPRYTNTSTIPLPVSRVFGASLPSEDGVASHTMERCRAQLSRAFGLLGACRADLNAGDSVLVPQGWWHSAEGIGGPGVGIGAWFR